jgi:hypothetical protein
MDPKKLYLPMFSVGFKLMTSRFKQELGTRHPQVRSLVPTTNITWRKQELMRSPTWLEGSRNLLPTTILFLAIFRIFYYVSFMFCRTLVKPMQNWLHCVDTWVMLIRDISHLPIWDYFNGINHNPET